MDKMGSYQSTTQEMRDGARLGFMKPHLVEETDTTKTLSVEKYDSDKIVQELKTLAPENYAAMNRIMNSREFLNSQPQHYRNICFIDKNVNCIVKINNLEGTHTESFMTVNLD
jgi:hypothetical protein